MHSYRVRQKAQRRKEITTKRAERQSISACICPRQVQRESSALRAYCTSALAGTYPGSREVSVVTGSVVAVTCTPAKRSYPEKKTSPVSLGVVPCCEVDGVRAT